MELRLFRLAQITLFSVEFYLSILQSNYINFFEIPLIKICSFAYFASYKLHYFTRNFAHWNFRLRLLYSERLTLLPAEFYLLTLVANYITRLGISLIKIRSFARDNSRELRNSNVFRANTPILEYRYLIGDFQAGGEARLLQFQTRTSVHRDHVHSWPTLNPSCTRYVPVPRVPLHRKPWPHTRNSFGHVSQPKRNDDRTVSSAISKILAIYTRIPNLLILPTLDPAYFTLPIIRLVSMECRIFFRYEH